MNGQHFRDAESSQVYRVSLCCLSSLCLCLFSQTRFLSIYTHTDTHTDTHTQLKTAASSLSLYHIPVQPGQRDSCHHSNQLWPRMQDHVVPVQPGVEEVLRGGPCAGGKYLRGEGRMSSVLDISSGRYMQNILVGPSSKL